MNRQDALYLLQPCPAIFDYGVEGLRGLDPTSVEGGETASPATSPVSSQATLEGDCKTSDHQDREASATYQGSQGSEAGEPEPSVSIALDGTPVLRAPLSGSLCIPAEVVARVVDLLTEYAPDTGRQSSGGIPDEVVTIDLSVVRGSRRRRARIVSLRASRDPEDPRRGLLLSSSGSTRGQIDRHTVAHSGPHCRRDL